MSLREACERVLTLQSAMAGFQAAGCEREAQTIENVALWEALRDLHEAVHVVLKEDYGDIRQEV